MLLILFVSCGAGNEPETGIIKDIVDYIKRGDLTALSEISLNNDIFRKLSSLNLEDFSVEKIMLSGISGSAKIYSLNTFIIMNNFIKLNMRHDLYLEGGIVNHIITRIDYSQAKRSNRIIPEDIMTLITSDFDIKFYYDDEYKTFLEKNLSGFIYNKNRSQRNVMKETLYEIFLEEPKNYSTFYSSATSCRSILNAGARSHTIIFEKKGPKWQITEISEKGSL